MPSLPPVDLTTHEAWESLREQDEPDGCVARRGHEHDETICPRSSQCHCARPIGHPIPVPADGPRAPRR